MVYYPKYTTVITIIIIVNNSSTSTSRRICTYILLLLVSIFAADAPGQCLSTAAHQQSQRCIFISCYIVRAFHKYYCRFFLKKILNLYSECEHITISVCCAIRRNLADQSTKKLEGGRAPRFLRSRRTIWMTLFYEWKIRRNNYSA